MILHIKPVATLLAALMLVGSPLGKLGVTASAVDTAVTNSYVLRFAPEPQVLDYPYDQPYLYTTPFTVDHIITKATGEEYYAGRSFPEVYNLINTTKLDQDGEEVYASIAAYSADASASIWDNSSFRRINLEDAGYFPIGAAGRIRAVVLHGYPNVDTADLEAAANEYLREMELPEIVDLQSGEAILGTQIAIWKLANGEDYIINSFFGGMQDLRASWLGDYLCDVVYPENENQIETEHTARNIESLYTYLYNLEPVTPLYDAVSEATFENPVCTAVLEKDGSYTITVTVTVNTSVGDGDALSLSAACGEETSVQEVTAAGTYSETFRGVPERLPVKLELNGYQYGGDVYLFDAEGDRGECMSMVGWDDSRLPVHGQLLVPSDTAQMTISAVTLSRMENGSGKRGGSPTESGSAAQIADIRKDVGELDCNSAALDMGVYHTWIIRGSIPEGIANADRYMITDTIDYRLTYQKASPLVKLYTKAGEELLLRMGTHYALTESKVTDGGNIVDQLSVAMTAEGMTFVADNLGTGSETAEIRVYFQAMINENASMGESIPDNAHLNYTDAAGTVYEADSDIPEVHTGGINLRKTDTAKSALAGASFKVAREATDEELADARISKEILEIEEDALWVVYVDFHATADLSKEKITEVTTDENGKASMYGLAYGTYYIVETRAPTGYNLLTQPIAVIIDETSHLTVADGWRNTAGEVVDNTVYVINTKFILPDTGGMGTTHFTVAGVGIILTAGMLLLMNRKRRI